MVVAGVGPNSEKRTYFRDSAGLVITCEEVSLSQCSGKTGSPKLLVTTTSTMESPPGLVPRVPLPKQLGMASDTEPGNQSSSALLKDQSRRVSVNPTPQKRLSLSEAENLSTTNNPPERTCSTPSPQDFVHGPSTSGEKVPGSKKPHASACEQGNSGHDSALIKDLQYIHQKQPLRKNHPLEKAMAVCNIEGGIYDVDMESSSSPPLKPLSNLGHRYSRRGKSVETSQRRLAFVSDSSTSDKVYYSTLQELYCSLLTAGQYTASPFIKQKRTNYLFFYISFDDMFSRMMDWRTLRYMDLGENLQATSRQRKKKTLSVRLLAR